MQLAGHFKQCHLRPACLPPALVPSAPGALSLPSLCRASGSQCIIFSPFPSISRSSSHRPLLPHRTASLFSMAAQAPPHHNLGGPLVCRPVAHSPPPLPAGAQSPKFPRRERMEETQGEGLGRVNQGHVPHLLQPHPTSGPLPPHPCPPW